MSPVGLYVFAKHAQGNGWWGQTQRHGVSVGGAAGWLTFVEPRTLGFNDPKVRTQTAAQEKKKVSFSESKLLC